MKIVLILNPISGRGKAAGIGAEVARMLAGLGHDVRLSETRAPGDARAAAGIAAAADAIVCVGGDGTVNEVVNGMAPATRGDLTHRAELWPRLAVVPVGTGNVLAKELGLPRAPVEFCAMFVAGKTRRLDIGLVRPPGANARARRFVLMAGAGFDAQVVRTFHAKRKGTITMGQYFLHSVRELMKFRPPRIAVEADGRILTRSASFVQIANVASYGGPFLFSVGASPDDGWLRLMWFTGKTRFDVLRLFCGGFSHVPVLAGNVHFGRARTIRLLSDDRVPLQTDGDPAGMELPVEIAVVPRALVLLVS